MSRERREQLGVADSLDQQGRRAPRALILLGILLVLEGLGMAALALLLIVETFTAPAESVASAIALAVCAVIAAIGLIAAGISTLRGARWIRAFAFVWQVVQLLVGLDAFQGIKPRPDIGTALIVPALLVLVLLFTRSVVQATRRR